MDCLVLGCSANWPLAQAIAQHLNGHPGGLSVERFPDGELHVEVRESVRGRDVYVVQSTSPPSVGDYLLELLLTADACQRAGAARLTALIPYFGYARQDRRASGREPVAARLIADLIQQSAIERVVALDLHSAAIEGFFGIPLEQVSAVPLLAEVVKRRLPENTVILAPDLGAVKLAERYAQLLSYPVAIIHKSRLTGGAVAARGITGQVEGRGLLVVDDMISTGATVEAAIQMAAEAGALAHPVVAATHALLVGPAVDRLSRLSLGHMVLTDSVALPERLELTAQIVTVAPLLAEVVRRLHGDQSLDDLISHW